MKPLEDSKAQDFDSQDEDEYIKSFKLLHKMLKENTNSQSSSKEQEGSSSNALPVSEPHDLTNIARMNEPDVQIEDLMSPARLTSYDRQAAGSRRTSMPARSDDLIVRVNSEGSHGQQVNSTQEYVSYEVDDADTEVIGEEDYGPLEYEEERDESGNEEAEEEEEDEEEGDDEEDVDNLEDEDADEGYDDEEGEVTEFFGSHQRTSVLNHLLSRTSSSGENSRLLDVMQSLVSGLGNSHSQRSELASLIDNLHQREDSYLILESLNELSERLLMMDGVTAERVISPQKLSNALVSILRDASLAEDLELHLVACRCLYNFIEVNSDFINDALESGAVEALISKLKEVIYIDLTEQCLQTLEIMSQDRASHTLILSNDGIRACLQNLDFFTIHTQRKCLSIVANACNNVSKHNFDAISSQFDHLIGVIQHHADSGVRESAWLCLSHIIKSFNDEPALLESLFNDAKILTGMMTVIQNSCNPTTSEIGLSSRTLISLVTSMIVLVSSSPRLSLEILNLGVGNFVMSSLSKFGQVHSATAQMLPIVEGSASSDDMPIEALIGCPNEVLILFLQLIAILIPKTASSSDCASIIFGKSKKPFLEQSSIDRSIFVDNRVLFQHFINKTWSVLIGSFQPTMEQVVRKQAMACISRVILFYSNEDLVTIRDIDKLFVVLSAVVSSGKKSLYSAFDSNDADPMKNRSRPTQMNFLHVGCIIIKDLLQRQLPEYSRLLEKEGLFSDIDDIERFFSESQTPSTRTTSTNVLTSDSSAFSHTDSLHGVAVVSSSAGDWEEPALPELICEIQKLGLSNDNHSNDEALSLSTISKEIALLIEQDVHDDSQWSSIWQRFANLLVSKNDVSTFEFMKSGLVEQLLNLLVANAGASTVQNVAVSTLLRTFLVIEHFLAKVLKILQTALDRIDSFEIIALESSQRVSGTGVSLAKQIKLSLLISNFPSDGMHDKSHSLVISVQAITTFESIVEFLKDHCITYMTSQEAADADHSKELTSFHFTVNGLKVTNDCTVFGAVFRSLQGDSSPSKVNQSKIWNTIHRVECDASTASVDPIDIEPLDYVDSSVNDNSSELILRLMSMLYYKFEERGYKSVFTNHARDLFVNWNLTMNLLKQLDEHLIIASGVMPAWFISIPKKYPFLFPLNTRMMYLRSTSFGISRLMQGSFMRSNLRESVASDNAVFSTSSNLPLGMSSRKKIRIDREQVFRSALKLLLDYADHPGLLEIEYFGEVGSGLGPTLEFYSATSKEFQRNDLALWRSDSNDTLFAYTKQGLFPVSLGSGRSSDLSTRKLFLFNVLGRFVARSLHDSRIVDFDFNELFLKLVQNPHTICVLDESVDLNGPIEILAQVDDQLSRSLSHLHKYLPLFDGSERDDSVELEGMTLADLSLTFVLPGSDAHPLKPNGASIAVTPLNLEEYLRLVIDSCIGSGVKKQIESFREGFSTVFPISSISIFFPDELREIFGSCTEDWSRGTIFKSIKANHGYSLESEAIGMLAETLEEFNVDERRQFLQFLTGSPRLPIGGFGSMRPEFTVVKKQPDEGFTSDDYLPSVMTCANYLKLPEYSSKSMMKKMIARAMTEGAGAFHLS